MTVKQEIKNYTEYRKQIKKITDYLSSHRRSLTSIDLTDFYTKMVKLGYKYADGKTIHGYCAKSPYWTGLNYDEAMRGSKKISSTKSKDLPNSISVDTRYVGVRISTPRNMKEFDQYMHFELMCDLRTSYIDVATMSNTQYHTMIAPLRDIFLIERFVIFAQLTSQMVGLVIKKDKTALAHPHDKNIRVTSCN